MNIFGKVTWKAMWKNRVRTLVTIAGVILSAAMFTAVTTMVASLLQFLIDAEVYESGSYFISYDIVDSTVGDTLRADADVDQIGDYRALGYVLLGEEEHSGNAYIMSAVDETVFDLAGIHTAEGRLPENSSEVLLPERAVARLEAMGLPHAIGETVALEILPDYIDEGLELPSGTQTVTKTYTIVGVAEGGLYIGAEWEYIPSLITVSDGTQTALWHRYFATTSDPKAAYDVEKRIDAEAVLHYGLLNLYGATKYANYNTVILSLVAVLFAIIMVGSVSLIYNAFSISVAERTKQFGLLSSIGATKRQLRRSVFFEAGVLCLIGIPLGLACGWGGIAVTLHFVGDMFSDMLSGAAEAGITLRAVVSPVAMLAAAAVGVLTVFTSAWIPARRATRVSPMAAIRQSGDYQVNRKQVRVSRLSYKLWGLPGVLAKKYYSVSRKKYRATVISLAVSVLLFITVSSYAGALRQSIELSVNTENYDFMACWLEDTQIEALRSRGEVTQSAVVRSDTFYYALVTDEMMSQGHLQWLEKSSSADSGFDAHCRPIYIYYLEDSAFMAYLQEQKIDPAPYFDPEEPMALVCNKQLTGYSYDAETGELARYTTTFSPFSESVTSLELGYGPVPEELYQTLTYDEYTVSYEAENGKILLKLIPWFQDDVVGYREDRDATVCFEIVQENGAQAYYAYDMAAGARAMEPTYTLDTSEMLQELRLGAAISELPFGIPSNAMSTGSALYGILPLSAARGEPQYGIDMALRTSNYEALKIWLDDNKIPYSDELSEEMRARNIILLVNVFSYGFIILISLICVCNVFNTISTNIALRRRDFGMLRSVGLKHRELYRMMHFECLRYGVKALLAGLPLSLLSSYGIHTITYAITDRGWQPPWLAMAVAAGCIFLVVFSTMLYAVSKLRKDNPIDAIRMENL